MVFQKKVSLLRSSAPILLAGTRPRANVPADSPSAATAFLTATFFFTGAAVQIVSTGLKKNFGDSRVKLPKANLPELSFNIITEIGKKLNVPAGSSPSAGGAAAVVFFTVFLTGVGAGLPSDNLASLG
jgi:hypothetical protein